jgi:hypothetical protein
MMPTLQEIIDFHPIGKGDGWDICSIMETICSCDINSHGGNYNEYKGDRITCDNVVDVVYDHRRGAMTSVMRIDGKAFAVVSRAGRELDDTVGVYIIDPELAASAVMEQQVRPEFEDVYNVTADISLKYWEGTQVELGDSGQKGDWRY